MCHIQLCLSVLLLSVNMKVIKQVYAFKDHLLGFLLKKRSKSALLSVYEFKNKILDNGIFSDGN